MANANERDFAPLSLATVRGLNDKLYEKRKVAALEIEKMVRDYSSTNNTVQIKKLLQVLGHDFALSQNPNSRKGGLIGLAATSIALGKDSSVYVHELVKPVLTCFFDSDSRVRYYGCESLYNIVKVARGAVLPYFNDIFDGLSKLSADPDQNVRSGSELLDRLMKDIVTESCQFDLVAFIPLLRERIYTKNAFARQFLVAWISALDAVPDIDMLIFLPEILDGLLQILGDPNTEIRKMCDACLGEFLQGIRKRAQKADFPGMVNVLICHSQSPVEVIQHTSLVWLHEFIHLSGPQMLPFTSGILTSILPCFSYDDIAHKSVIEAARTVNSNLMKLIANKSKDSSADSSEDNAEVLKADIGGMVEVLSRQLIHDSMSTRVATLRWIFHLFLKTPNSMFNHVDELFPLLLKTLSDPSDEVVLLDLEVLAELSSSGAGKSHPPKENSSIPDSLKNMLTNNPGLNSYFVQFMISLLQLLSTDRQLLEDRGSFIIRQLCIQLSAEDIYRCCAEILLKEKDTKFASCMIKTLSTILLTSTELFELRTQLKELKSSETCTLFSCLYKSWCHNPVATVALCFLTQNYQHASDLLSVFGDLEVTVDLLTQVDKLVQLIESPIFTYLRLQLLDVEHNQALVKSLYGLLMLLPQSDAFRTLQRRLECIPKVQFIPPENRMQSTPGESRIHVMKINFEELLQHFQSVQETHRKIQKHIHKSKLTSQNNGR